MLRLSLFLSLSLILGFNAYAQPIGGGSGVGTPVRIRSGNTLPSSCVSGPPKTDIFIDTNATSGQRIYVCESGSWVLQGDGGGGGAGDMTKAVYDTGDNAKVDWADNINSAGINWAGLQGIQTSDINWTSIYSMEIQSDAVNWTSLDQALKSAAINWTDIQDIAPITEAMIGDLVHTTDQVGTVTSSAVCRGDGSAAQCDYTLDASGTCTGNVCGGGHTHPTTEVSGVNAGTDLTADLEEETHASEHIVGGADTVFAADPNANSLWTWDDTGGNGEWGSTSEFSYSGTAWTIADSVSVSSWALTTPKVITSLNDTSGNELFKVTATGSAVNEFTIANAAASGDPVLSVTGDSDANIDIGLTAKGTGGVIVTSTSTSASNFTTGITSSANDLGWSVVDQADNQACTTGCTNACVLGIANATGTAVTNLVSCADTTADLCLCAGGS